MGAFASWQDDAVGWNPEGSGPGMVRIVRAPDGPVATSDFEGQVGAVGIGPTGIVVRTHSALDFDAFVTSLLGSGWVEHMVSFAYQDGVLRITTDDDRDLEVVWAEHGLEPGDVADRGFGWYSPDGEEWSPIPDFPANVDDVVGVSDGFIARGFEGRCDGCGETADPWGMWHSSDGLTWRQIGPATEGDLLPWMGAVLVSDGTGCFDVWTSEGVRALPMALEMPARSTNPASIGVGPLGLVSLRYGDRRIVLLARRGRMERRSDARGDGRRRRGEAGRERRRRRACGPGPVVVTRRDTRPVPVARQHGTANRPLACRRTSCGGRWMARSRVCACRGGESSHRRLWLAHDQ